LTELLGSAVLKVISDKRTMLTIFPKETRFKNIV